MGAWVVLDVPSGWLQERVTWCLKVGNAEVPPGERLAVATGRVVADMVGVLTLPRFAAIARVRVDVEVPDRCVLAIAVPATQLLEIAERVAPLALRRA